MAHRDKTLTRIQKHFPESKRVLDPGNYFVIISVLDSAKCFRILGRVSDSGKCFVPTRRQPMQCVPQL